MIKNVLFDLDGTIIDSSKCIFSVYTQLFGILNLPLPPKDEMRRFIGPPIETMLGNYLEGEELQSACNKFRAIYDTVDLRATNFLYEGIDKAIEEVGKKRRVYLATSKSEPKALEILSNLNIRRLFDGVYGSRYDLGRSKKWEILEAIVSEENLDKDECILIGDTAFDVEGAEKSGIRCAIVRYGFGQDKDFVGKDIAFFADNPFELIQKIEEL